MATEIGRSLSELTKQTTKLGQEIKKSKAEASALDKQLKLNPGNVDLVRKKYAAFEEQLTLNRQKMDLLNKKRSQLDEGWKSGALTQKEYERQLAIIKKDAEKTASSISECTVAINGQNAAIRSAKIANWTNQLEKAEQKTSKLSKATLAFSAALVTVMKQGLDYGGQLDDLAHKYSTTAEALQIQEHRFLKITGSSEGYTSALEKIGSIQSSIASGRGARYLNFLKQLGISQEDLNGKNNGEIYELIASSLANVSDETERATIAQGLFGTTGLDVALVAGTAAEQIQALDETLIENGIVTSEQAALAGDAGDMVDNLTAKFKSMSVEVLVDLLPIIETVTDFLKNTVIPIITDVTGALSNIGPVGQKIILALLVGIVLLPKVIGFVKTFLTTMQLIKTATDMQTVATTALTTASTPWLGIIMAVSAALMLLVTIISMFINKSKEAVDISGDLMNSVAETQSALEGMGYTLDTASETTYNTNTKKDLNVNVDISAHGDTSSAREYANDVGNVISDAITADVLNEALGAKVR